MTSACCLFVRLQGAQPHDISVRNCSPAGPGRTVHL